eukprot:SAG11_NODE_17623_length_513_cov_1.028986_1_plen_78_part_10
MCSAAMPQAPADRDAGPSGFGPPLLRRLYRRVESVDAYFGRTRAHPSAATLPSLVCPSDGPDVRYVLERCLVATELRC